MASPLVIALLAVAAAAVLSLLSIGALWLFSGRYVSRLTADEHHTTTTGDGWTLSIAHWRARGPAPANRLPVILCHGLGATAMEWDLAEHVSLPRLLRDQGWDVWAVDLRGRSNSTPPAGTHLHDYALDHHIAHDVPAAIALVKNATGAAQVAWVGHSMGGTVIYGHAEATAGRDLACVATIASPAVFLKKPQLSGASPLLGLVFWRGLHAGFFSRLFSPVAGYVHPPQTSIMLNPRNVEGWVQRIGMASSLCDLSTRVLRQFARSVEDGRFVSEDGTRVYFERLADVKTPWLAIGGAGDNLVRWPNAHAGFDRLGSPEKSWILVGVEHGHSADYGHCDLVMGPRAKDEVFAPIVEFLERHAARVPVGASAAA